MYVTFLVRRKNITKIRKKKISFDNIEIFFRNSYSSGETSLLNWSRATEVFEEHDGSALPTACLSC